MRTNSNVQSEILDVKIIELIFFKKKTAFHIFHILILYLYALGFM